MEMAAEHMNAKVSLYLAFLTQARTDIPSFERLVLGAGGFTTDTSTTYLDRNGNTVKRKNLSKQAKNTLNDYELVFCQVGVGRFGVSFSPCERRVSGRFGVGRSCWLLVIALVIA